MPFVLVILGLLLIVSAIRGTHGTLWNLLYGDILGSGGSHGFLVWLVAILAIGFMGYYKPLETPAKLLLGLVVLSIFIANNGVFKKLSDTFSNPLPTATTPATTASLPAAIPVKVEQTGGSKTSAAGNILGKVAGAVVGGLL